MAQRDRLAAQRLRRLADAAAPQVRRQVERALSSLQAAVPIARLERVLASRDAFALHDLVATLPTRLRPAVTSLRQVFMASGQAGRVALPQSQAAMGVRFDGLNQFASEAARHSGAKLVSAVTNETRQAIRTVVSRAFTEGIPPREIAHLVRPVIGLTARQARGTLRSYQRGISHGLSAQAARGAANAYGERMLRKRALLIARTETIRASTDGQVAGWQQSQQVGLLSNRARKVWITTADDRLCPQCAAMDGQQAPVNGAFKAGLFGEVAGPPLHPACRCAIGLLPGIVAEPTADVPAPPLPDVFAPTMKFPPAEADASDTLGRFARRDGTLTPERQRLHDAIVQRFTASRTARARPTTMFMGGGPAAGKSNLLKVARIPTKAVHVDPDEIKKLLPEFIEMTARRDLFASPFVHEESSMLAKRIAREAHAARLNVLNDGTGDGSYANMAGKVAKARQAGRRIVANYVTVDTETAIARALERGAKTGRYVQEDVIRDIHASVSRVFPEAIENGLFDEATLWDTNGAITKVASAVGKKLTVHDAALWERFLAKGRP